MRLRRCWFACTVPELQGFVLVRVGIASARECGTVAHLLAGGPGASLGFACSLLHVHIRGGGG
jgi:hypothetical protein